MSEAAQLAKSAREHLAAALNALQSNANVPDGLMAVAEPIAEAMSVLHRVERTDGGDLQGRDSALANVRTALNQLQAVTEHHPAVDLVMEAVAASLAKVHALTRWVPPAQAAAAQPAASAPPGPQPVASVPRPRTTDPVAQPAPAQPAPAQPAYAQPAAQPAYAQAAAAQPAYAQPAYAQPAAAQPAYVPPAPAPAYAPPPAAPAVNALPVGGLGYTQALPAQSPMVQPDPFAAPQAAPQAWNAQPSAPQQAYPQNVPVPATTAALPQGYAPHAQAAAPVASRAHAPVQHTAGGAPPPTQGAPRLDVELGANSSSNFYKGLGGNDVIEHGGIFVATYKVPKIGAQVVLRVLLPGDYEFQANAVVQWTRESSTNDAAEPGFGARFTQIAPDARQLVYRYTRNREPLFYDDL
jgi:hypothetical protein